MLSSGKTILDDLEYDRRKGGMGQISLFDMGGGFAQDESIDIPELEEFPLIELLNMEKEMAGLYLSGHPIDEYSAFAQSVGADRISDILNPDDERYHDRSKVKLIATVNKNKTQITKNNKMMAFVDIEDRYGTCEMIVFPNVLEESRDALYAGAVVQAEGTLSHKEEEDPRVLADKIIALPPAKDLKAADNSRTSARTAGVNASKEQRLYLKVSSLECREYFKARNLLEIFPGSTKVIFYLSESRSQVLAPKALWASLNPTMLGELKYQLGDENVIVK